MAAPQSTTRLPQDARRLAVFAALLLVTAALYARTSRFDFVDFDDWEYVTTNRHVQEGLTPSSVKWAFTAIRASNWHPLTWLSHMLDWQVFGSGAAGPHAVNAALHVANTALLLLALASLTGSFYRSAFVAALFALHPLHVESVAWVSERKDLLSTFFGLLALGAYARYARTGGWRRYLPVPVLFALSLMAKPMWVTLPFLLLLLDWWPLGRFDATRGTVWPIVREKIPLLLLSAASSAVTMFAQRGAVNSLVVLPLVARIENALWSYVAYLRKTVWPSDLAVFYPYPTRGPSALWAVFGLLFLSCVTILVLRARVQCPYLAAGWFWYVGMLVPVIGLLQVGSQTMADRYTYVPLIGIFVMVVWSVPRPGSARSVAVLAAGVCACLLLFSAVTWAQVGYWRDSKTLMRHALHVTSENHLAHNNLAVALLNEGQVDEAIEHFEASIRLRGNRFNPHFNYGRALAQKGRLQEAITQYREALELKPDYADAHSEMAAALTRLKRLDEAVAECRKALTIDPEHAAAYNNLAVALALSGRRDEAEGAYRQALRINPDYHEAHSNLAALLARGGRLDEAIAHLRDALRVQPSYANACNNLVRALYLKSEYAAAWQEVERCRRAGVALEPAFVGDLVRKMPPPRGKD